MYNFFREVHGMTYLGSSSCTSFTKPGFSKTENERISLAMKASIALVILASRIDVRVNLLFRANASCSLSCPVLVLAVLDVCDLKSVIRSLLLFDALLSF